MKNRNEKQKRSPMLTPYLNTIIHGDALSVLKTFPSGSVGLVVTSPPYNLNTFDKFACRRRYYKLKRFKNSMEKRGHYHVINKSYSFNGYAEHDDGMPYADYVKWQRSCLRQMLRLIKPDGAIFYNHKWRIQNGLLNDRSDILKGFPVRQIIVWDKGGSVNFNDTYFLPSFEVIYVIAKEGFKLTKGANLKRDVWYIYPEKGSNHPAPFPEALSDKIISSTDAEVVLDPFVGSGTTAISALKCGRKYIGIDNAEEYVEMAESRIREYLREPELFEEKIICT